MSDTSSICPGCGSCEDLTKQLQHLTAVNKQQEKTISWMHDTIWELISQNKKLKAVLEKTGIKFHS